MSIIDRRPAPPQVTVLQIAQALGEGGTSPRAQIREIVRLHGPERALAWLAHARALFSAPPGACPAPRGRGPGPTPPWLPRPGAPSLPPRAGACARSAGS